MRIRKPSPAMMVALLALFIALGGTAVAAAVPLAKRALVADNARKLGGRTANQIITAASAVPGPATSASGLVTVRNGEVPLPANTAAQATLRCQSGERAISGGWTTPGDVFAFDSAPTSDGQGWQILLDNASQSAAASVTMSVVCLR